MLDRAALLARLAEARARYPELDVPEAVFVAAVEARVAPESPLEGLHLADLYLATACARGDAEALRVFEAEHVAKIPQWLGAIPRGLLDEVRQRVRARVLMADAGEAPPRIAGYSGRGPLGAWVRVVTLREHASLRREAEPGEHEATRLEALAQTAELTPELVALKRTYQPIVSAAFRAALEALPPRSRTLLRLCYLDGLGLDAIGTMYGVNKSTVSRWLAATRVEILDRAREHVRQALGAHDDVDSLMALVQSQVELSLHGLLA